VSDSWIVADGTRADWVMPYHGDRPDDLREVADRLVSARGSLAQLNDFVFDATDQLASCWDGDAAATATTELQTLRGVTARAVQRLDDARTALLNCSDDVEASRLVIDSLRAQWDIYQGYRNNLAVQIVVAVDATGSQSSGLVADARRYQNFQQGLLAEWVDQAAFADQATSGCRNLLDATLGDVGDVGSGAQRLDLGTALGIDGLHADDIFVGGAGGSGQITDAAAVPVAAEAAWQAGRTAWLRLSPAGQRFLIAAGQAFPPPTAVTPQSVNSAWQLMNPLQQQALIAGHPEVIGAIDGVPVVARDQANRLVLTAAEASVRAELAALPTITPTPVFSASSNYPWSMTSGYQPYPDIQTMADDQERSALAAKLSNIQTISNELTSATMPPRYLIGVKLDGRGQAIVAVGDPDTAPNVTTYVPGAGSDIGSLGSDVGRAELMQSSASAAGVEDPAVVTWIGYESPPEIDMAEFDSYADAGAPALDGFLDGLRATHLGPPSLNTVLGHSYAGLLIAVAASGSEQLAVDQVVLVAPSGTELAAVDQLQLAGVPADQVGGRVFVMVAPDDFINHTSWVHADLPADPAFGATVVAPGVTQLSVVDAIDSPFVVRSPLLTSLTVHSAYWDVGSPFLAEMGRLMAGRTFR
jgi:Alpha/beta hydrolase